MMSVGHGGASLAQEYYDNPNETQKVAVEAIKSLNKDYLKMVGYSDAYARVWASNSTPEYTAMLVNSDVHSPNRIRVMAALPMIDTWYDAFNIKKSAKMFVPKEQRALVW